MTPNLLAVLVLATYLAIAMGVAAWQFRRSGLNPSAWLLWALERFYVSLMFHWRANRRCPFPNHGGGLILANHRSPVDPLLIWMNNHLGAGPRRHCRIIGFLMAREYYEVRGLGSIARTMRCIPVRREGKDMQPAREALERLKRGDLLGVFPEGGINLEKNLREGDTGIAWLALHAQVPVFPVFIQNSPSGERMVKAFFTRCRVKVLYGDPIDLSAYYERKRTRALLREVTDLMMRRLSKLGGVAYEADLRPVELRKTESETGDVPRATG